MATVFDDARAYLSSRLGGVDMSSFADDIIRDNVEKIYPDGWTAFQQDYQRYARTQSAVMREVMSPIKRYALVKHFTKRTLSEYDEILSADFGDLVTKIVIKFATVDRRSRRDRITGYTIKLYVFTRESVNDSWTSETLDIDEGADLDHVRFGAINTPDRDASTREQVETCYRPGTERTPMRGWVARLEVSHKQAHANDTFQKPSK